MQTPCLRLTPSTSNRQRRTARLAAALLLLALTLAASAAQAATCTFTNSSAGTTYYAVPAKITVPAGAAIGTVVYSGELVPAPTPNTVIYCDNRNYSAGINNLTRGGQPTPGATIFPTGVAGIGYRVGYPDNQKFLPSYPTAIYAPANTLVFSIKFYLQFVVTAGFGTGGTLASGNFANRQYANLVTGFLALSNSVTFAPPACQVKTPNVAVTLPTVGTSAFSGAGSTAGETGFNIDLSCSSGAMLQITLDTVSSDPSHAGTITNAGTANGVGVQILDGSGTTAVTFGTVKEVGATPDGDLSLGYTARYIQTASSISAGSVNATSTFTLSYL